MFIGIRRHFNLANTVIKLHSQFVRVTSVTVIYAMIVEVHIDDFEIDRGASSKERAQRPMNNE